MKEHPYLKNKQKSNDRVDESYDTYLSNYVAMKNAGGGSNEICVYDPVTVDATLGKHTNYKVKVSMRGGRENAFRATTQTGLTKSSGATTTSTCFATCYARGGQAFLFPHAPRRSSSAIKTRAS